MEVVMWPIDRPVPYARNPRRNQAAVAKVAASIREFGWRQPVVVDETGVIIAGHTRLLAAQQLGLTEVPVHVATGLTPAQVKAYRLADNRIGQEAEWDDALLALEFEDLKGLGFDVGLTGFDDAEMARIIASALPPSAELNAAPSLPSEPVSKPGDLYRLGAHRLLCGDAQQVTDWARLMDGVQADMVWTDPPYGVSYVGKTEDRMKIKNDDLGLGQLTDFLRASLSAVLTICKPGGTWYVAGPHGPQFLAFATALTELGVWRQTIVWVKPRFALGRSDFHYRHEVIATSEDVAVSEPLGIPGAPDDEALSAVEAIGEAEPMAYGWAPGGSHAFHGDRRYDTVWEFPNPSASREHPTMKPVELITRAITLSSARGDVVVDAFAGSGSTLIAAEATGRVARCMELDPRYCDVIVQRWERLSGERAERLAETT